MIRRVLILAAAVLVLVGGVAAVAWVESRGVIRLMIAAERAAPGGW